MHVAILGAGVIGVTAAYALARQGCKVTIFDQAGSIAAGASFANGAQLSYSFVDPMASPTMLKKLPAILMGRDDNSKQQMSFEPDYLKWGASFIGNCLEPKVTTNLIRALDLAVESRDALAALLERHRISFRFKQAGKLVLTRSSVALERMSKTAKLKSEKGVDVQVLSPEECWNVEPSLKPRFSDIAGGVYAPGDQVGDARRFTAALAHICSENYDVDIHLKEKILGLALDVDRVVGVQTGHGVFTADKVVVCLGAASAPFLKKYDVSVLIEPIKGYSFTIPANDHAPMTSITDADNKLVFARLDSEIRIAGLADYDGRDMSLNPERLEDLKRKAETLIPDIGDYDHSGTGWVGARPMTPDGLPIIGNTKIKGLYLNTGHGMLGWTFACGSAERLAKVVTGNVCKHERRAAQ